MMSQSQRFSQEQRETFDAIGNLLIPEYGRMPALTDLSDYEALLDKVLSKRPDIANDLLRGLDKAAGQDPSSAANELSQTDAEAFNAISLAASATYYMSDEIRALVGYPGQDKTKYDPNETPAYLMNGMVERVMKRGPIYRSTQK